MNQGWMVCTGAAAFGGIGIGLEIMRELSCFRVRRYRIKEPRFAGRRMKFVFLSDLHARSYGKQNEKLLSAVRGESPDYILVGGDMLIRSELSSVNEVLHFMKKLSGIAPVYCANGNHEQQMKQSPKKYHGMYAYYRAVLKSFGIRMIENASLNLEHKGVKVTITGLEIPLSCYGHFKQAPLKLSAIESRIGTPDRSRYQILMAHNPVYMEEYRTWGADLALSGHLHGGVVRIPGIGGLITPQIRLFPKYSGDMYQEEGRYGIVSRGLGTHTVNVRLFNMAELISVTLE